MTTPVRQTATNKWRVVGWSLGLLLLLLPLIAMQFTKEVSWQLADFVIFALMLGAVGAGLEFVIRATPNWRYRLAAAGTIIVAFFLAWVSLAVGFFGDG